MFSDMKEFGEHCLEKVTADETVVSLLDIMMDPGLFMVEKRIVT